MNKEKKESSGGDNLRNNEDLTMIAYNGIKNLLFRNEIVLGQQLNSRRIAEKLSMSSTPVIQALKLLHFQGLIAHIPQRGYFLERNSREVVRNIYNQRLALELANINDILVKIDNSGWQKLEEAVASHEEALNKNMASKILMADVSFHLTLAEIASGVVGKHLLRYLFEMLYLKSRSTVLYIGPRQQFCSQHQEILQYLRKKDVEAARVSLGLHIQEIRDLVLEDMRRNEEDMAFWQP